jgi:hypothetical protein
MTMPAAYVSVRWLLLGSLVLLSVAVGAALSIYPAVVTTARSAALVYVALFALAILVYGWVVLALTRITTAEERIVMQHGIWWGLLCGGVWMIELIVANLLALQPGGLHLLLYYGSTSVAMLLPGLAALLAAQRAGRFGVGLQAGLLCGMCGAIGIFLATIALAPLLLAAGPHDPQTLREFQRSALPDLTTFMVGDYLAGMIAHLWIGLITGLVLGVVGGTIGKALATPHDVTLV